MHHRAFEFAFAELGVPRAHARALKTGTEHNIVLIEALDMRGLNVGAAPVEIVQRAPSVAVAVLGFLLFHVVLLQNTAPARAGIGQLRFVAVAWPQRAGDDDGFEFFRAKHGSAAVRGEMVVIVGEHRSPVHVFAGRADAEHSCVAIVDDLPQSVFGVARADAPDLRGVTQFRLAVFDVEINRFRRGAGENDSVVTGGLQIGSPITAGRAAT